MKTFKLEPFPDTLDSLDWQASIYRGTATVSYTHLTLPTTLRV